MSSITVTVKGHWINAWFMYLFARPYVVIDGVETRVAWGRPRTFDVESSDVKLGAGIRYANRGRLLGYEPVVIATPTDATPALVLVLRNGVWNHQPFRVVRATADGR